MSQKFFSIMNEINTYGCALPPSASKPTTKPMQIDKKPAPPTTDIPTGLREALDAPMPQRPGMTVGEHLAEFDSWVDCNGTSFDRLIHMGFNYSPKDKTWKAPPMGWSANVPWDEPEVRYSTETHEQKNNASNNVALGRILDSSIGAAGRGKKRARETDETSGKVAKRKVEAVGSIATGEDVLHHAKEDVDSSKLKKRSRGAAPTKSRNANAASKSNSSTASSTRKGSPLKQEFAYSDSENEHPITSAPKVAKEATAKKAPAPKKPPAAKTNKNFAKSVGMKLTRSGKPKQPSEDDEGNLSMSAMAAKLTPEQVAARKVKKEVKRDDVME